MALTRKFLTALGIEPEKIDEIITAHTEVTDALKEERDKYKADAELLPDVTKERDELKAAAEKNKDNPYKAQYEDLKKEYDEYKDGVEKKEKQTKINSAYKSLLKEVGINEKRLDAILRVSDLSKIELDDEGKIKDADEIKKTIKEEWSDFIVKEETHGAQSATPPENGGSAGGSQGTPSRAAQVAAKQYEMLYGKKEGSK